MAIFVGVLVGGALTIGCGIMSLAGLLIAKHGAGGGATITNLSVAGAIHQHDSVPDLLGASGGIIFLEAFAGLALFVMITCGGFHCTTWCHHCHGAQQSRENMKTVSGDLLKRTIFSPGTEL